MSPKRLIGCILVRNQIAVQSFGFRHYLPIGKPEIVAEFLNRWGVDEIVLLDMDASPEGRSPNLKMVQEVAAKIFTPLTVGGGVSSLSDFQALLHAGADKVSVNTALTKSPELLREAAECAGSQCVIASIDAQFSDAGYRTRDLTGFDSLLVEDAARLAEEMGAGEILLNSVAHEGSRNGFDLPLINQVCALTSIPIIAMGGAGHPMHVVDVMQIESVSAVAIGNMFHHSEHSVAMIKAYVKSKGLAVRTATGFENNYGEFDEDGRLLKKEESILDDIRRISVEDDFI